MLQYVHLKTVMFNLIHNDCTVRKCAFVCTVLYCEHSELYVRTHRNVQQSDPEILTLFKSKQ